MSEPMFNVVITATSITQTRDCSRGVYRILDGEGEGERDFHSSFTSFLDSVNHCLLNGCITFIMIIYNVS